MSNILRLFLFLITLCCYGSVLAAEATEVPVLAYHRFGPKVTDGMMVTTTEFENQVKWLKDNGFTIVPLKTVVNYLRGEGPPPPAKAVVITADDGHKTVWEYMQPIVKKYNIPVTLFIYPSAISNASYAMTWDELQKLKATGLFDIQSHTYWHPNFNKDKKKLSPAEYEKFVNVQLDKSKAVLEKKLNIKVEYLAWPFGIYDQDLEKAAAKAGYVAAFSIDARDCKQGEQMMSQPRYLMVTGVTPKGFEAIVTGHAQRKGPKTE